MKAALLNAPRTIDFVSDLPDPASAEGETIVRVEAVGICGSDLHVYRGFGRKRAPGMILGHEIAGQALDGPFAGKRVTVNPIIHCQECEQCHGGLYNLCQRTQIVGFDRPGGYARYVAAPTRSLVEIGNSIDAVHASLAEPSAVGLHAVTLAQRSSARPLRERQTLIIGGGAIGMLSALWMRALGAYEVTILDTNENRHAALRKECFKAANPSQIQVNSADLVMDCVGSAQTRHLAVSTARPGAVVIHIGFQEHEGNFLAAQLTRKELQFLASFGALPEDFAQSVNALQRRQLGSLEWVESRPLEGAAAAFEQLASGAVSAPKIVLLPS